MTASFGKLLLPIVQKVTSALSNIITHINNFSDVTKTWIIWGTIIVTTLGAFFTALSAGALVVMALGVALKNAGTKATITAVQLANARIQNELLTASAGKAGVALSIEAVGLKAVEKGAIKTTWAIRTLSVATKGLLILSVVGIIAVIGQMVYSFFAWRKQQSKTKDEMAKLNEELDI